MASSNAAQDDSIQKDDLRHIYELSALSKALCTQWPTRYHWEHSIGGPYVSVKLHGVAAVIMFLRRMYAFSGGKDLCIGKPTLLSQLSWRDVPLSDKTEPGVLQALFQELGVSANEPKGPTFLEVLNHDSMGVIWGTPSMSLYSPKAIVEKKNQAPIVRELRPPPEAWRMDIISTNGGVPLEERMAGIFKRKRNVAAGSLQMLCNFPTFVKVHYQASNEGSRADHSFSNLGYFRFRGPILGDGTNTVEKEHLYVLLACFFNPDKKSETGELRLYSDHGIPIVPRNDAPLEFQGLDTPNRRSLGDPILDVVMLYGKTDHVEEHLHHSELPPRSKQP